jgi:hypothetical protein
MSGSMMLSGDAGAGEDGRFEVPEAVRVLAEAQRDVRRRFEMRPPGVMAAMAVVTLAAYTVLWLSTRGQHPYAGPNLGVVALVYAVVAVCVAVAAALYRRASAGVHGPSARQRGVEGIALAFSVAGSPILQGAMKHAGASHAIVYGTIPAAGPLIVIGTTLIAMAAGRNDRAQGVAALVIVTAGTAAAYVGPSLAWLVAGIGLFAAICAYAALADRWIPTAG